MSNTALINIISFSAAMLLSFSATAQEQPPRPVELSVFQNLNFGAIIQGNTGGQVIIDPQGSRTYTGDVYLANLGYSYTPAIFEIVALPGALITINNGPDVMLLGSNGGTLKLEVGTSIPSSPFINTKTPPFHTQVRIGGKLTLGNSSANPAGNYIGYFTVTFIQQ